MVTVGTVLATSISYDGQAVGSHETNSHESLYPDTTLMIADFKMSKPPYFLRVQTGGPRRGQSVSEAHCPSPFMQ